MFIPDPKKGTKEEWGENISCRSFFVATKEKKN
jgi:hypothetical protein